MLFRLNGRPPLIGKDAPPAVLNPVPQHDVYDLTFLPLSPTFRNLRGGLPGAKTTSLRKKKAFATPPLSCKADMLVPPYLASNQR